MYYEQEYMARQQRLYEEVHQLYKHPFYGLEEPVDGDQPIKKQKAKIVDFRPKTDK